MSLNVCVYVGMGGVCVVTVVVGGFGMWESLDDCAQRVSDDQQ